jgi:hypothetical protein
MREGDAGERIPEMAHLLPPRHVVASQPMGEDDRRALAADLVVDLRAVDAQPPGLAKSRAGIARGLI